MFNHLLGINYKRMNFCNHVGYCIVMYRFIEKCSFGLQLFLNVKKWLKHNHILNSQKWAGCPKKLSIQLSFECVLKHNWSILFFTETELAGYIDLDQKKPHWNRNADHLSIFKSSPCETAFLILFQRREFQEYKIILASR